MNLIYQVDELLSSV